MGVVYRARHAGSDRVVALKTVKVPTPRWLEAIRREIHALRQINHPGVVRITEHGVDQGLPWYAMDLLEGPTLQRFAERIWSPFRRPSWPPVGPTEQVSVTGSNSDGFAGSASERTAAAVETRLHIDGPAPAAAGELRTVLRIMRRVCATLAYLHGEGFVNCDLKPANIVLLEGRPVIIDFGLAAHQPGRTGREALEAHGGPSGTPPYMSPEQVRGDLVDARSDLYAFGCILYELVTGSPPFAGAPVSIRSGHLHRAPLSPSQVVTGVPEELERVMLKLLDKDLALRFGYADEVATILASLCEDVHRLPDYPPPRPYLYRPRLVGRDALVAELTSSRDKAARGTGALVLLAGESGVGKTRIAMEATRAISGSGMLTVTSESSLLPAEGGAGASPLQAVRPLLQAIADHCQAGGAETTQRLLGDRRSVLAQYEPLLAQVPAQPGTMTAPMPLAVDASRRRLFQYLSETLSAFAQEQPVLWVIDDLGWADDLSLSFLQSLTQEYLESTPALILCTYRSEEATDALRAIAALPHVRQITVPRLGPDAVSEMVGDMLAMPEKRDDLAEFVSRQSEGNPFFVTEYLRAAVAERVLYRDGRHSWQMPGQARDAPKQFESLALPGSLREVIEQRLHRLSPAGQQAGLAAAVLGRETDVEVLREVASLSDEASVGAVDELLRRQVLEQTDEGRVRFVHDKLREVAYAQAPAERIVQLHGRAGKAIETRWDGGAQANEHWATIGHHFAAAKLPETAAKYLKLAADHARATFANEDAIRLYRESITQVGGLLLSVSSTSEWHGTFYELNESLGDLLLFVGDTSGARAALGSALKHTPRSTGMARARQQRKLAQTSEREHHHDEALAIYAIAQKELGTSPEDNQLSDDWWREWVQIQVDCAWNLYFLARVDELDALVADATPMVERYGSPAQRFRFFTSIAQSRVRRARYRVDEAALKVTRLALQAGEESSDLREQSVAAFAHAFPLTLSGRHEEAEPLFLRAIAGAERIGDETLLARILSYFGLLLRSARRISEVRTTATRALTLADKTRMFDYKGVAHANLAWTALNEANQDEAGRHARSAVEAWGHLPASYVYPLQWVGRVPYAVHLHHVGQDEAAFEHLVFLLREDQQLLTESAVLAIHHNSNKPRPIAVDEILSTFRQAGYV